MNDENRSKQDSATSKITKPAQIRKIVIKTAIRAGQGKNRYATSS